ncbi:MAG: DHH family phosphoesterase [Planctomycetota bacterium]|jgi:phosphoesterase RecJ-like protein
MTNSDNFKKAVELIEKSSNILVTTHARPDGDACGAVVAMAETLTALGKKATFVTLSAIPQWYEFLFAEKPPLLGKDITVEQLQGGAFDLVIIVDTNSYSQLAKLTEFLKENEKPVLVIDHHVTSDNLGDVELIDTVAAASLIVYDLLRFAKWPITKSIAKALFVGITMDTGWFQFENTNSSVHRVCAELIDLGLDSAQLYQDLYQNYSRCRFELMVAMLNTLEFHFDGRYVAQHLRGADFERTGAAFSDTENLIDECRRIASVEVAALFVELPDGQVKVSLRSTGTVDVRKIAQKFGGGGHTAASGAHMPGPLEKAKDLITAQVEQEFQGLKD